MKYITIVRKCLTLKDQTHRVLSLSLYATVRSDTGPYNTKNEHGICIIKFGLRPSSMAYVLPEKNDVLEWHFTKYTFMKIKQGNKILLQKGMFLH
jgi:hypothetical protein